MVVSIAQVNYVCKIIKHELNLTYTYICVYSSTKLLILSFRYLIKNTCLIYTSDETIELFHYLISTSCSNYPSEYPFFLVLIYREIRGGRTLYLDLPVLWRGILMINFKIFFSTIENLGCSAI